MERTIWKELFESRILQRGYDYYLTGAVKSLNTRENRVEAEVLGSELYEVEAEFDGGRISHWHCDCPYAAGGTPRQAPGGSTLRARWRTPAHTTSRDSSA